MTIENVFFCLIFTPTHLVFGFLIFVYINLIFVFVKQDYLVFVKQSINYNYIISDLFILRYVILLYYTILYYILHLKIAMVRLNWRGLDYGSKTILGERLLRETDGGGDNTIQGLLSSIYIFFEFMLISRIDGME